MWREIKGFQGKGKNFGEEECQFGEDGQSLGQARLTPNEEGEKKRAGFQEGDLEGERRREKSFWGRTWV